MPKKALISAWFRAVNLLMPMVYEVLRALCAVILLRLFVKTSFLRLYSVVPFSHEKPNLAM